MKAKITSSGAVILGKYFACDSHEQGIDVRVVTHAHVDHMIKLNESLKQCKLTVMTEATKEIIEVIRGKLRGNVMGLKYNEELKWNDEKLTLYYADHIIGAAQVLVEDHDGERLLYTGDFRLPKTPIIEADILVIEATYGKPKFKRPPTDIIIDRFVKLVKRGLAKGPVHIFGFHGKIQEAMEILRDAGIDRPFIASSKKIYEITQICRRHGMRVGEVFLKGTDEARELTRDDKYIMFHHASTIRRVKVDGLKIHLTGWEFRKMVWQVSEKEYRVALSDHADFTQLLLYIASSKPKLVITDNYRVGYAKILAREVEKRLGIKAMPMPS
ncbi:hypothetical protein DRN86_04490 [Candidatus Geothermarchaeota archaeon]|nr:MAG: hypothetical protein DRN86_04490 [Candidatus Geothermarchaeota archaeon]